MNSIAFLSTVDYLSAPMQKQEGIRATSSHNGGGISLLHSLGIAVIALTAAFAVSGLPMHSAPRQDIPAKIEQTAASVTQVEIPAMLSRKDIATYSTIFQLQARRDWRMADKLIPNVESNLLVGHIMAERYLSGHYQASYEELAGWLRKNQDNPKAYDIYQLALAKKPGAASELDRITKRSSLKGYGDDVSHRPSQGKMAFTDHALWMKGIAAWKKRNYATAAGHFARLSKERELLSSSDRAGASFWAYRAFKAAGKEMAAQRHLEAAASEPRSFYGILAYRGLGWKLDLDLTRRAFDQKEIERLYATPAIQRATALSELRKTELAESELRQIFPHAEQEERKQLLMLANALDLPAVEMRMGRTLAREEGRSYDFAVYPTPNWQPRRGFDVDPALIYAFARQESGFHARAQSHAGARGIMQLMPQTAHYVVRNIAANDAIASDAGEAINDQRNLLPSLYEPIDNITLGQSYIRHLMEQKYIGNNLFYLAAAYNAGPGKLLEWQKSLDYENDPLLFVESIPYVETRNYVRSLMSNYWIYSEILHRQAPSVEALLEDSWPLYAGIAPGEFASLENRFAN